MTVDAVKFSAFISYMTNRTNHVFNDIECSNALTMIENMYVDAVVRVDYKLVDELMLLMRNGEKKIDAIKVHRQLTGFGLKESKDAVEKYWVSKLDKLVGEVKNND